MSTILNLLLGAILGGILLYLYLKSRMDVLQNEQAHHSRELEAARQTEQTLRTHLQSKEQEIGRLTNRLAELTTELTLMERQYHESLQKSESLSEDLKAQFKVMAHEIMQERSEAMLKRSEESLLPLRDNIKRFEERFNKVYEDEARERYSLEKIIRELMERSLQVSAETKTLTNALRGDKTKMQGDWGEMILENILEHSGLRRGQEYFTQEVLRDEEGHTPRPDVIVKYPNGGFIIIDSKVSLTAYTRYVAAETEEERIREGQQHLSSVRRHIKELAERSYQDLLEGSPDFVLLFMPNEPSYNLVMELAPNLWEEAYSKRIVLINGTNLIAALRMAQDMWQRDRQIKNVEKVVNEASKLYDQFALYTQSLLEVERQFERANGTLQEARRRLTDGRGNLISRLEKLRMMGLKNKKNIPESLLEQTHTLPESDESEE